MARKKKDHLKVFFAFLPHFPHPSLRAAFYISLRIPTDAYTGELRFNIFYIFIGYMRFVRPYYGN